LASKIIVHNECPRDLLKTVKANAMETFETGLENTSSMERATYQARWISFKDLAGDPKFTKKPIKVIGDKKAGGTAKCAESHREAFVSFVRVNRFIKLLQIVRDPVGAAMSLMKSHKIDDFEQACSEIVRLTNVGHMVANEFPDRHHVTYYEDLLTKPEIVIYDLLNFLDLKYDKHWLTKICEKINTELPSHADDRSENHEKIAQNIISKFRAEYIFARYYI